MMEAIKASKSLLRKEITQRLAALSAEAKQKQSEIVTKKLLSSPVFKDSKRISLYCSTNDEISTEPIIKTIFEANKLCFIPRYNDRVMEMVKLESMDDYRKLPLTNWNIKQPDLTEKRENAMETGGLDLVLVPGLAFTPAGARLGRGKGFYDEFLNKIIELQDMPPRTVALAFREQVVEKIPCQDHDIMVDLVLHPDTTE